MSIVSCPKCADSVVMPEGSSPAATVRCPLCQEEFQLSELLDAMPPALIVVEDPEAADQPAAPDSLFFADSAADRPINLLDEVETDPQPRAISIGPLETSSAPSTTPSSGKGRRVAPRPQRKKKNPAVEVAKVFFGGVAGLVIAQALLWWLPWSNYRRDPFELGPKVSEFAGWMVPEQFHGKGKAKPAEAGGAGPAAINTDASPQPSGNDVFGPPGTGLPQRTFVDPNKTQDDTVVAGVSVDPLGDLNLDLDADLLNMIDPADDPIIEEPTLEEPSLDESGSGAGGMGAQSPVARIAHAPEVSGAELRTALDDANTVVRAWMATEDANDRQLIVQSYQALAKLAEAVTFAGDISGEQLQAVSDLLSPLISDPERLSSLKMIGQRWPAFAGRDGTGILLVGTVVGTKQEGDIYVTELEVTEGDDSIAIYQDGDPAADCPPGASIVVLGPIVDDPENNVAGYAGDAASLIWTGQSQVLAGN